MFSDSEPEEDDEQEQTRGEEEHHDVGEEPYYQGANGGHHCFCYRDSEISYIADRGHYSRSESNYFGRRWGHPQFHRCTIGRLKGVGDATF